MRIKKTYAVIVAAGSGKRMGAGMPKQLLPHGSSTVIQTAVSKFRLPGIIDEIIVVSPSDGSLDKTYMQMLRDVSVVRGGAERNDSVYAGLKACADKAEKSGVSTDDVMVLIHDAARPGVDEEIIKRCINAMQKCRAVTAALPSSDSIRMICDAALNDNLSYPIITSVGIPRDRVYNAQTPQVFRLGDILRAHETARDDGFRGTDDASYAEHIGIDVGMVLGSRANAKITTMEDIRLSVRVGNGYDVHRLVTGRRLVLCGVQIPHERGLDGHSDADVAVHALMDAMLGAVGLGDIGRHFPDDDPAYEGADSMKLLAAVAEKISPARVGNADITIVAQAPRLAPYIDEMRDNIANTLGLALRAVNVKATTEEGLGFTGRGEGISAYATCTIEGSL